MDLHGIEWVLLLYELTMLVLPVYGLVSLRRHVKYGALGKLRAFGYYTGLIISPVIAYVLFFLALVGLEQVSRIAFVTEGLSRSLVIVLALGLAIWLISSIVFGLTLVFIKRSTPEPQSSV